MDIALLFLAGFLVIVGLSGTVLPALPGTPLVFGGLWLAAWVDHYQRVGPVTLVVLGILTALSMVVDIVAGVFGAKRVGASTAALIGSAVGTIIGLFMGLFGVIVGPFVGAFLGEYWARRNIDQAGKVGLASWLGFLVGTALKLAITFMMIGIFLTVFVINTFLPPTA